MMAQLPVIDRLPSELGRVVAMLRSNCDLRIWAGKILAWCGYGQAGEDCYSDIIERLYSIDVGSSGMMSRTFCFEEMQRTVEAIIFDLRYTLTNSQRRDLEAGFYVGFRGGLLSLVTAKGKGGLLSQDFREVPDAVLCVTEMIGARLARAILVQPNRNIVARNGSIQNNRTNWVKK